MIDAIATDHAPHAETDKQCTFSEAANGIIGLETAFALAAGVCDGDLLMIIERLTAAPARVMGWTEAGSLKVGKPADIVIIDPEAHWKVSTEALGSKSANTPLLDMTLRGRVVQTFVGGMRVWDVVGDHAYVNNNTRGPATLVLQDGSVFVGSRIGAETDTAGLVVFNTSMTGYEEMLTDPSYGGQILVATYPLIGNYGISLRDAESGRVQVQGFVVRAHCDEPSHPLAQLTVHDYLTNAGVPGLSEVDTRAITRRIRSGGAAMGAIVPGDNADAARRLLHGTSWYGDHNWVDDVSTRSEYRWDLDDAVRDRATDDLERRGSPDFRRR